MRGGGLAFLLCLGCAGAGASVGRVDLSRHFDAYAATGAFVMKRASTGDVVAYDSVRAATGFIPASTFKIFNSLVILDQGVIGIDEVIPWDGVVRNNAAWDQDQRMREAFQRSTVWFYQELARRVGPERMAAALLREGYGNGDMGGGIDTFWLTGDLRISAFEQVQFLERLYDRELGFAPGAMDQVVELLQIERCPDHVLRGKTGWGRAGDEQLGWLVGWVERVDETYYFAMNLQTDAADFPMPEARQSITRGILSELGVLPPPCEPAPT